MKWEDIKTYADAVVYRNEKDLYNSINGFDTEEEAEIAEADRLGVPVLYAKNHNEIRDHMKRIKRRARR